LKIAYAVVCGILVVSLLGFAYVHLRPSGDTPARQAVTPTTIAKPATTTTQNPPATTVVPTNLSPSAEDAAAALVASWSEGNRLAAVAVATPTAATTLFNVPYSSGLAIDRGCSTSTPSVCTFGPPGGASPTDRIYEITVSQAAGGWYVSSVRIEN
jgi:hypothetical protein